MEYFAGIDVSLAQSSVCVMDGAGKIVRAVQKVDGRLDKLCKPPVESPYGSSSASPTAISPPANTSA